MFLYTIYTYDSIEQLRKIQEEKEVIPFVFGEIDDLLEDNPDCCVDISAAIYLLRVNRENSHAAYLNLREMTEETVIILEKSLANDALRFLPHLFSSQEPYYQEEGIDGDEILISTYKNNTRQQVYTYNNVNDITAIIAYANEHNIPLATFSSASGNIKTQFEKFNKSSELALVDLTSVAYAIEDNKNLIYSVEMFLEMFPNLKLLVLTSKADLVIKYFPLYIEGQQSLKSLLPDLEDIEELEDNHVDEVKKVTSLLMTEFNLFIKGFCYNLIGHEYFKERFEHDLKNFITLNRVKEQKVFSIFLFGASGIGKTEVARLISSGLNPDSRLPKINFQNYSRQDALNSLIGSPAGYVGCEHGELSMQVTKSKVGVVLFDEFEKATRPVFSFFLELLEEGKFTDSMAREYDLDGYILVFTSNYPNVKTYKEEMLPELQTRFDLVFEFQEPSHVEKTRFLDLLLEQAELKFPEKFSEIQMTAEEKQQLYNFDYSNLNALREIKKIFNNRLMDLFDLKGV